jgi:hypothetical protein
MKHFLIILLLFTSSVCFAQTDNIFIKPPYSVSRHWLFDQPYDSISGSWVRIAPLQGSYFGAAAYYWNGNGKVFICGGIDSLGHITDSCYLYSPQTNTYQQRSPLPQGRYLGKLVKLRDSLYLVGSVGSDFYNPDGALYKYDMQGNTWQARTPVTGPSLHEMAVCVWRDSLIITIGGSSNGFGGAVNQVRVYDPWTDTWSILPAVSNLFPVNITSAQAECIGNDIVLVGGYNNSGTSNEVYRGYIYSAYLDSLSWNVDSTSTPFNTGVYRTASSQFGNSMIFGPALSGTSCINQVWSFSVTDSLWTKFSPNSLDTASRTSVAVRITSDSMFFYLFGGITRDSNYHFINKSERFSTVNPLIGIPSSGNQVPQKFLLAQNYPNPFNPVTSIEYSLPKSSFVTIKIYDMTGRETAVIVNGYYKTGKYKVIFNGENLSSGVYFYRLISDSYTETRKMVLLK